MVSRFWSAVPLAFPCLWAALGVCNGWVEERLPCEADSSRYEGLKIRQARISSPFSLPGGVVPQLKVFLQRSGSEFHGAETGEIAKKLGDELRAAPLPDVPFSITAVAAFLENCDPAQRQVDVVYYLFATRLVLPRSWTWESRKTRSEDPRTAAGVLSPGTRFTLTPALRFDQTDRVAGGGRLVFEAPQSGVRLMADGTGSTTFSTASAELSGTHVSERAGLWQLSYAAGYQLRSELVQSRELRQGFAYGRLSGATRPLSGLRGALRYGAQYERGYQVSALNAGGFATDARYSTVKLAGGLSGGKGAHDYALQAGLQLVSAGGVTNAYRKFLLDGVYGVRIVPKRKFFDHRAVDLEWRSTAGWLTPMNGGVAPQNERFFGGVRERRFLEMPDWDFRATPVIRSFPSNRFLAPQSGTIGLAGRERFFAMNFTGAITSWRVPLLPKEVRESKDFKDQIEAGKGTARAALESYHESKDPALEEAVPVGRGVEAVLMTLTEKLDSLTVSADLEEALEFCQENVEKLGDKMPKVLQERVFAALLNASVSGTLPTVTKACGEELNAKLTGGPLSAELEELDAIRVKLDNIVRNKVNHALVKKRAEEDSALAERALDAFSKEINLVSVDPVFIYDVGYVGSPAGKVVRHGVGGGVRLTFASHVSFMAGYAVNANRGRGDPGGAAFFNIKFMDLIR